MNNQMEVLVKKIDYLYQKIEDIIDERSEKQMDFLLREIDEHRTSLLELEIQDQYKEIENETNQG